MLVRGMFLAQQSYSKGFNHLPSVVTYNNGFLFGMEDGYKNVGCHILSVTMLAHLKSYALFHYGREHDL